MAARPAPHDTPGPLPVGTYPAISDIPTGKSAMRQRIIELESLCAEVYEAAVVLGLPQGLLEKLWMVAARGNHPRGFALELPADSAHPADVDIPLIHRPASAGPSMPELTDLPERRTVMVVEDDPAMRDLIVKILSNENYDLVSADSGDDALDRLEREHLQLDLLITDLMMPGMTGSELATAIRLRQPMLRVLYETGFTDTLFKSKQELEPGAAFLEKPFSARGLIEAARLALFGTINPGGKPS